MHFSAKTIIAFAALLNNVVSAPVTLETRDIATASVQLSSLIPRTWHDAQKRDARPPEKICTGVYCDGSDGWERKGSKREADARAPDGGTCTGLYCDGKDGWERNSKRDARAPDGGVCTGLYCDGKDGWEKKGSKRDARAPEKSCGSAYCSGPDGWASAKTGGQLKRDARAPEDGCHGWFCANDYGWWVGGK